MQACCCQSAEALSCGKMRPTRDAGVMSPGRGALVRLLKCEKKKDMPQRGPQGGIQGKCRASSIV